MILAGDIGGTNTRLALFEGTPNRLTPRDIEVFPSPQFSGLPEIVRIVSGQAQSNCRSCRVRIARRGGGWARANYESSLDRGLARTWRKSCTWIAWI